MDYERMYTTVSGNIVGVVEQPRQLDPSLPMEQQIMVKIGVVDEERARREDFSADDAKFVTENLMAFLRRQGFSVPDSNDSE